MQKPGMRGAVFLVILRPKSSYFVRPSWQDWFKIGPRRAGSIYLARDNPRGTETMAVS